MFELAIGLSAALLFPVLALAIQRKRDARRNRRAGRRRSDRIRLN